MSLNLAKIRFTANFVPKLIPSADLLVPNLGSRLDELGRLLVDAWQSDPRPFRRCGRAHDFSTMKGTSLGLRLIDQAEGGEIVATDVLMRRDGANLSLRLHAGVRTDLVLARRILLAGLFVGLLAALLSLYIQTFDVHGAMIQDYARKHFPGNPGLAAKLLADGIVPGPDLRPVAQAPFGLIDVMRADPAVFLANLGHPPMWLGALIGGLLSLLRRPLTSLLSGLLRWSSPDDLHSMAGGAFASAKELLSQILLHRYGIQAGNIVDVRVVS